MKNRLLSLVALLSCALSFSQLNHTNLRLEVLNNNVQEQLFVFGKWNEQKGTETHLKYLGNIKTKDEQEYKIMTSCWFWGPTKKSTNTILVYDNQNELLGKYYLDTICWLPSKIENNKLIFKPSDCSGCDKPIAEVNFDEGIPNAFFVGCKASSGNIYSFYGK